MASTSLSTLNSLAMATSLRLSTSPLLNPKSRSSPHLLRLFSSKAFDLVRFPPPKPSPSWIILGVSPRREPGFLSCVGKNGGGESPESDAVDEADAARGQSTMPERFRPLTKEAPDRPVRWPWVVALVFLVYAWRTVLWELANWKKSMLAVIGFFSYLFKLILAFVFHFIGEPITVLIRCMEFALYSARYIYSSIVAFAPVPELTRIILFTSTIVAIAEATVPDSANSQQHLLTLAGIIGFGAVNGFVPELLFWLLLSGMFCYSHFIKKRDGVSAALPSTAVLAAVGEPWVRGLAIASYLALAIVQYSKLSEESARTDAPVIGRRLPLPLLLAALSIGIHLAAKWVRRRHLTWMIV
ncbi:uncharacterized protein [Elaeis guineensis]|uniref:Uncharacterized protein LOC105058474 n=1 Tax=Elaeis guineensis var. tenera TaxID=51953 RepID=A0A6I9S9P9_ELAGV|nr:uncharacterized protein LOC105058474 [Elaeis guineensis]